MSGNLVFEIPETEAGRFEALLDEINATVRRIREQAPERDARVENLQVETRQRLVNIREVIEGVEKTL